MPSVTASTMIAQVMGCAQGQMSQGVPVEGCGKVQGAFREFPSDIAAGCINLEPIHALPENSRFSVETFTFSPSLMKRGTRISRPVSRRAGLVLPPDESPRTAGSV